MDRLLLERMTGAAVILLLLVLVAPALLDGEGSSQTDATGDDGSESRVRTEVIYLQPGVPPPAAPEEPEAVAPIASSAADRRPAPPAPEPQPASPAGDAGPGFAVQVGSFSGPDRAQQFARQLRADGYQAFIQQGRSGTTDLYRVYSGPEGSREAAEALSRRLSAEGYSVMVTELERVDAD